MADEKQEWRLADRLPYSLFRRHRNCQRKYCAGVALVCFTLVACEDVQRLPDEVAITIGEFNEFTPHDMAECAGMYRDSDLVDWAEIATGATRESSRSVYGWTDAEVEEQIEGYRRDFGWRVSEATSEQCGRMLPLMSLLWERGKINRN